MKHPLLIPWPLAHLTDLLEWDGSPRELPPVLEHKRAQARRPLEPEPCCECGTNVREMPFWYHGHRYCSRCLNARLRHELE